MPDALTDPLGRPVVRTESGEEAVYTVAGVTMRLPLDVPLVEALARLAAMAPPPVDDTPRPEPVPQSVALSQLLRALRAGGWISAAEALAAARTGEVPAVFAQLLAAQVQAGAMTQEAADDAAFIWAAMYQAERSNPLWGLIVAAGVATAEQIDDLFRQAARF